MTELESIAHALAMEYVRRTCLIDAASTPEAYAKEYYSAFDAIADELIRLDREKT